MVGRDGVSVVLRLSKVPGTGGGVDGISASGGSRHGVLEEEFPDQVVGLQVGRGLAEEAPDGRAAGPSVAASVDRVQDDLGALATRAVGDPTDAQAVVGLAGDGGRGRLVGAAVVLRP